MHVVKVPQFFISFKVGVGENDIFIFPLFPMCSHHIAYNLTMGSHQASQHALEFPTCVPQHVPNDIYLLSRPHWKMASSSFLVPIIFLMGSKKDFNIFSCSQCVPNTHHITIHLYPICGGKCYPPFIY